MIRIWTVEDNATFRKTLIDEINSCEDLNCDRGFGSCEALLEELGRTSAPDVILLDISLPGLSGLEAISTVKSRAPGTQILMLTMADHQDSIFRALCAGASGYLLKAGNEDIPESIRQVASGALPLSAPIAREVLGHFTKLGDRVPTDYHLTPRERSILALMVEGFLKKQIADRLDLSFHTVDDNLRRIYRKLHVHSGKSAVAKAIREKLC